MNLRKLIVSCSLGLAMIIASSAVAQTDGEGPAGRRNKPKPATDAEPALEENSDPGMLAGPTVEDEASQGSNNPMNSPNNAGRRRAADQNIPLRQWLEAIRSVGLSDQQQQEVTAIAVEFQTAQREFQAEHGEEMRQLQQQARAARESGKEPPAGLREKIQMLESSMPRLVEYQKRIWELLNVDQQAAARARLAEIEKRMQEQRRRGAAGARGGEGAAGSQQPQRTPQTSPRGRNVARPATDAEGEMLSPSGQSDRADPQMSPTGGDEMSGAGMTESVMPKAESAPATPIRERAAGAAARRRGSDAAIDMSALDAAAQSRVRFLRSRVSASRAGNAPSPEEKTFRFVEDQ